MSAAPHDSVAPRARADATAIVPYRAGLFGWLRRLVLLLLVLVAVGLGITQTEWGEERIRVLAVQALHDELGIDASLDDVEVEVGLWPPGIRIEARQIDLDHPVHGDFIEAEELLIRPSLLAFFSGRVDLHTVVLRRPVLRLKLRDGRIENLPELPGGGGQVELPFTRFEIVDGSLELDAQPFGVLQVSDLDIAADVDGSSIELELGSSGGRLYHTAGEDPVRRIAASGRVELGESTTIELRTLEVDTAPVSVSARDALVALPLTDGWTASLEGRIDVTRVMEIVTPFGIEAPALEGVVELDVRVRGELDGPHGEGTVHLADMSVDGRGLGDIELELEVDPAEIRLREGSMGRIRHGGGRVALEGSVKLDEAAGFPLDVHGEIHGLELEKLLAQIGVGPDAIVRFPMDGTVELRGTLVPLELDGPVRLRVPSFQVLDGPYHARTTAPLLEVPRGRIQGRWRFSEDALRFTDVVAETARSRIRVPLVLIGFEGEFRVDAASERLDLRDVSPLAGIDIAGQSQVTVAVTGDLDYPVVAGHINAKDFRFGGFRFGDIETDAQLVRDHMAAFFPNLRATKNDSRYRVDDLLLDFTEHLEVSGNLRVARLELEDLYHVFGFEEDERFTPFQSVLRGHSSLHYTLGFAGDGPSGTLEMDMDFDLLESTFAGFAFQTGKLLARWRWLDWSAGVEGGRLDVHHFSLAKGQGTVNVVGRMDLGSRLALNVSADRLRVRETEGFESLPQLEGLFSMLGEIRGTTSVPRMHLDLSMTGLRWDGQLLGDARAYVRLTDKTDPWVEVARRWDPDSPPDGEPCAAARVGLAQGAWRPSPPVRTVDGLVPSRDRPMAFLFCGEGLDGQVRTDLAFGWTDVYPVRGNIDLSRLDLAPLLGGDELGGAVSGRVTFTGGSVLEMDRLAGRVLLQDLELTADNPTSGEPVRFDNDGPIDVRLDDGEAEVHRAVLQGEGTRLRVTGTGRVEGELALQVDGRVDLGVLGTVYPEVERSEGLLRVHVNVNGRSADPAIFGSAELSGGRIDLAGAPASITDLSGLVSFSERRVLVENVVGQVAGGRIAARGSATIRGRALERYSFDLDLRGATVAPDDEIDVTLSGGGRLDWQRGDRLPHLEGELRVDRASYRRDVQLTASLGEFVLPQRAEVEGYDPNADALSVDLRVQTRAPILVDNNLMRDVQVVVDDRERPFRIVGTDQRYGVLGNMQISQGTFRFRNSNLDVTRGQIRFDSETRVDPHFDVLAETEIRRQQIQWSSSGSGSGSSSSSDAANWRIQLHAYGTMAGFQLDATSQPQLSQEDIMLLMTIGLTSAEAQQLQAADLGYQALEAFSAISGVNDGVESAVGVIDEFAITSRLSPIDGRQEPMVTIGKRISDRVRLSASTGLTQSAGAQRSVQAGMQWQVGDQTSLQVLYDSVNRESNSSLGNLGVDLHWRLEFE